MLDKWFPQIVLLVELLLVLEVDDLGVELGLVMSIVITISFVISIITIVIIIMISSSIMLAIVIIVTIIIIGTIIVRARPWTRTRTGPARSCSR